MSEDRRVGVWLVGALGDVATTAVVGALAVGRGLVPPVGLVSEAPPLAGLDLARLDELVFGGHDVREGSPLEAADGLVEGGVVPGWLVEELREDLEEYGTRIRAGVNFGSSALVADAESADAAERRGEGVTEAFKALRMDLREFKSSHDLSEVVVVLVASTEPSGELPDGLDTADGVRSLVGAGVEELPASLLYALAAFEEGCAFVNFTPSVGASVPGLDEIARERGVPHMGNDGKTGQTLLRTVLAPMFAARNLSVLSWSGYNMLGNRDGAVLDEPGANAAKTTGKDRVLGAILGDRLGTSLTRIDYVPSLGDWKTAWDHVHFEGFLGTRMTLEFTWRGADSALAAPLVLDLVRLLDLAKRRELSGLVEGLACFFKTPLGTEVYGFPEQLAMLSALADRLT